MRHMIVMVGLPASGKSTIARMCAEELSGRGAAVPILSKDDFRALMCPTHTDTDGEASLAAGGYNGRLAIEAYKNAVKAHLKAGETVILDNTHVSHKHFDAQVKLAKSLGYDVTFAVITGVKPQVDREWDAWTSECVRRDNLRHGTEHVGEDPIRSLADLMKTLDLSGEHVVWLDGRADPARSAGELAHVVRQQLRVHTIYWGHTAVVGDIHGRAEAVRELTRLVREKQLANVVLLGDLFDRGHDIPGTATALRKLCRLTNVWVVEGNHDQHLRTILCEQGVPSDRFVDTREALVALKSGPDGRENVRWAKQMLASAVPALLIRTERADVVCTHGGLASAVAARVADEAVLPAWLTANDCIYGACGRDKIYGSSHPSDYRGETIEKIDGTDKVIQMHGHRNDRGIAHVGNHVWRLESRAEQPEGAVSCMIVGHDGTIEGPIELGVDARARAEAANENSNNTQAEDETCR